MANTIIIKNDSTASNVPAAGELVEGELAINTADQKLYSKDATTVFELTGLNNIVEDTTPSLGGELNSNGQDIHLYDNDRLLIGTPGTFGDGFLYSDGTDVILDLRNPADFIIEGGSSGNDNMAIFTHDGSVALYYNNVEAARTAVSTGGGWEISNTVTGTGFERALTESDTLPTLPYRFDSATTGVDPGAGDIRFDNATPASITNAYIDDLDVNGNASHWLLNSLADGDVLTFNSGTDRNDYLVASVNGAPTDNSGWWTVPLTVIHSGTIFTASDVITMDVQWLSQGGGVGTVGGTGTDNYLAVWNGTADIDAVDSFLITNALDKTATESVTGGWSFDSTTTLQINRSTGGEMLLLTDTGGAGVVANPFIAFDDSGNVRQGYVGFGSVSNADLYIKTDIGGIRLDSAGAILLGTAAVYPNIDMNFTLLDMIPGATTEGLRIGSSGDVTYIRPRDAAGTAWDTTKDFQYDRSLGRWFFDNTLAVNGGFMYLLNGTDLRAYNNASSLFGAFFHDETDLVIDTNSGGGSIRLTPDGGEVSLGTFIFDADQAVSAGTDNYVLTYDDGTGLISLEVAPGGSGTVTSSGTPLDNEIAVFTGGTDIDSNANFTYDATKVDLTATVTEGMTVRGPSYQLAIFDTTTSGDAADFGWLNMQDDTFFIGITDDSAATIRGAININTDTGLTRVGNSGGIWMNDDTTMITGSNLLFADNSKIQLGAGNDVLIYWDAVDLEITGAASNQTINFRDGFNLRVFDSTDVDYIEISTSLTAGRIEVSSGNVLILAHDSETFIQCTANGAVNLYHDATLEFVTRLHTDTGQTSGAAVREHDSSTYRDVGFNTLPNFNFNASDTLEAKHCGHITGKDNTTTTYKLTGPTSSAVDFPVGGVATVANLGATGDYTLEDTATCTMYYCDGAAAPVDIVLNGTLAPGGIITLWRYSTTAIYIFGSGFTA